MGSAGEQRGRVRNPGCLRMMDALSFFFFFFPQCLEDEQQTSLDGRALPRLFTPWPLFVC